MKENINHLNPIPIVSPCLGYILSAHAHVGNIMRGGSFNEAQKHGRSKTVCGGYNLSVGRLGTSWTVGTTSTPTARKANRVFFFMPCLIWDHRHTLLSF